jgi:site-specific DNA-methyltransferase (adenine-specific)
MVFNQIICGDAKKVLKQIDNDTVNLVITSPPYFQTRKYTKSNKEIGTEFTVDEYVNNLFDVFEELLRILKDDGNIVINLGDKTISSSLVLMPYRFAIKVLNETQARLANNFTWIKTNTTPKPLNKKRAVPCTEPFLHFVKSKNYYFNDSFLNQEKEIKTKNNIGQSYFEMIENSKLTDHQKTNAKNDLNRTILEVKDGKIDSFRMKINGIHALPFGGLSGGRMNQLNKNGYFIIKMYGNKIHKDIIECPTECIRGNKHPAIFPQSIVNYFIQLMTRENDLVLDPFCGSGTSLISARQLNRKYLGIDLSEEYVNACKEKLSQQTH